MTVQTLSFAHTFPCREQRSHVPYRNSKLTHLLQDSIGANGRARAQHTHDCVTFANTPCIAAVRPSQRLGGDAKMLLLLCVSPLGLHSTESLQSLQFGQRASLVYRPNAAAAGAHRSPSTPSASGSASMYSSSRAPSPTPSLLNVSVGSASSAGSAGTSRSTPAALADAPSSASVSARRRSAAAGGSSVLPAPNRSVSGSTRVASASTTPDAGSGLGRARRVPSGSLPPTVPPST